MYKIQINYICLTETEFTHILCERREQTR